MSSSPAWQDLEVQEVGDTTIVRLTERVLENEDIEIIGQELFELVEESGQRKVILDFTEVERLNSRDLGSLITLSRKLQAQGGWLTLSNANPQILEVLRITSLTKFFDIREDTKSPSHSG